MISIRGINEFYYFSLPQCSGLRFRHNPPRAAYQNWAITGIPEKEHAQHRSEAGRNLYDRPIRLQKGHCAHRPSMKSSHELSPAVVACQLDGCLNALGA